MSGHGHGAEDAHAAKSSTGNFAKYTKFGVWAAAILVSLGILIFTITGSSGNKQEAPPQATYSETESAALGSAIIPKPVPEPAVEVNTKWQQIEAPLTGWSEAFEIPLGYSNYLLPDIHHDEKYVGKVSEQCRTLSGAWEEWSPDPEQYCDAVRFQTVTDSAIADQKPFKVNVRLAKN